MFEEWKSLSSVSWSSFDHSGKISDRKCEFIWFIIISLPNGHLMNSLSLFHFSQQKPWTAEIKKMFFFKWILKRTIIYSMCTNSVLKYYRYLRSSRCKRITCNFNTFRRNEWLNFKWWKRVFEGAWLSWASIFQHLEIQGEQYSDEVWCEFQHEYFHLSHSFNTSKYECCCKEYTWSDSLFDHLHPLWQWDIYGTAYHIELSLHHSLHLLLLLQQEPQLSDKGI